MTIHLGCALARPSARTAIGNQAGRRIASVTPLGPTTGYAYDAADRLTLTTNPLNFPTTSIFDNDNRPTAVVDANGNLTATIYDNASRTIATQDGLGHLTTHVYDNDDREIQLVDSNGKVNTSVYDANRRLLNTIDPLLRVTTYAYDVDDRQTLKLDPRGVAITSTYDNANRRTLETFPNATRTTYAYDPVGNRTQLQDTTGTSNWAYDPLDQTLSCTNPHSKLVSYSYDADKRRSLLVDPDGGHTMYFYDRVDRMTTLVNPNTESTNWTYDPNDRKLSVLQANGVLATHLYDAANRVLNLKNVRSDLSLVSSFTYTYDKLDNRTSVTLADGTVTTLSYDADYQMYGELRVAGSGSTFGWADMTLAGWSNMTLAQWSAMTLYSTGGMAISYDNGLSYDPVGNRQTASDASGNRTTYSYDAANQLTGALGTTGVTSYSYDAAGNRTRRIDPTGAVTTYTWDYKNRLVNLIQPGSATTYVYDGEGRRVERNAAGTVTNFVHDLENILLETDGTGITQLYYTVSGVGQGQYGEVISQQSSEGSDFYAYDALGSTDSLTDSSGATQNQYVYTAFGTIAGQLGETNNERSYVGKFGYQDDFGSGVYFATARYYESTTGRWLSRDPRGLAPDTNPYRYVKNNPVNKIDPNGLQGTDEDRRRALVPAPPPPGDTGPAPPPPPLDPDTPLSWAYRTIGKYGPNADQPGPNGTVMTPAELYFARRIVAQAAAAQAATPAMPSRVSETTPTQTPSAATARGTAVPPKTSLPAPGSPGPHGGMPASGDPTKNVRDMLGGTAVGGDSPEEKATQKDAQLRQDQAIASHHLAVGGGIGTGDVSQNAVGTAAMAQHIFYHVSGLSAAVGFVHAYSAISDPIGAVKGAATAVHHLGTEIGEFAYSPQGWWESKTPEQKGDIIGGLGSLAIQVGAGLSIPSSERELTAATEAKSATGIPKDFGRVRLGPELERIARQQGLDVDNPGLGQVAREQGIDLRPLIGLGSPTGPSAMAEARAPIWSSATGDVAVHGTSLPGSAGVQVSRRLTTAEMESLTKTHKVEFSLVYRTGPGQSGGGGSYWLYSGTVNRVAVPISADVRWIYHTHPGGTAYASGFPGDRQVLYLLQRVGSPQQSSIVVPVGGSFFRFNINQNKLP